MSLRNSGLADFGIKTVWNPFTMSVIIPDASSRLKISTVWEYLGSILLRSLKVIPFGPGAELLLICLMFLETSLAVIMVQKTLSAWPISCNPPRPLTIPRDSRLDLNMECRNFIRQYFTFHGFYIIQNDSS